MPEFLATTPVAPRPGATVRGVIVGCLALLASGCGGGSSADDGGTPTAAPAPPWIWGEILQAEPDRVRVMPLGDSITLGAGSIGGYRLPLFLQLQSQGIQSIEFVGSLDSNWPYGVPIARHEGHATWTLEDLAQYDTGGLAPENTIEQFLAGAKPSLILLHAGTNDAFEEGTWHLATQRLEDLLDRIELVDPTITVIVALLIPTGDPAANLCVDWINERAHALVVARQQSGSHLQLADMASACPDFVSGDGTLVHPDLFNYIAMADEWLDALARLGDPIAPPLPTPTPIPGVIAVANHFLDGYGPDLAANGVGLQEQGPESGLHAAEGETPVGWRSSPVEQVAAPGGGSLLQNGTARIELRLQAPEHVQSLSIWNGRVVEVGPDVWQVNECARRVNVQTSANGTSWIDRGELELAPAPARAFAPPERIAVDWPNTRYVRIRVLETHDATPEGQVVERSVGFAEIELHAAP